MALSKTLFLCGAAAIALIGPASAQLFEIRPPSVVIQPPVEVEPPPPRYRPPSRPQVRGDRQWLAI